MKSTPFPAHTVAVEERTDTGDCNSVPGRGEQPKQSTEHTIVSSILTDLIFRRNHGRIKILSGPTIVSAKRFKIQNRHNVIIDYKNSSNFEYLGLQTK